MARKNVERAAMEVVSMNEVKNSKSKLLAFANVRIGDVVISGIKVAKGKDGNFVSFPSTKGSDGNYYNNVWFSTAGGKETNKEMYAELEELVLDYYDDNIG